MSRVPKKCDRCNEIFWCDLLRIDESIHGCQREKPTKVFEKVIEQVKTYKPEPKSKKKYECKNCDRVILSKTKRVYCCKGCQDDHKIKLSNEKWIERDNTKKKPAPWVNNALNMRATRHEEGGWSRKFKSVRG
jgi:hypothetical protein